MPTRFSKCLDSKAIFQILNRKKGIFLSFAAHVKVLCYRMCVELVFLKKICQSTMTNSYEAKSLDWNVPAMKQGRSSGESKGTNSACGFLFDARFAHAACHCSNAGTVSAQGLCLVHAMNTEIRKNNRKKSTKQGSWVETGAFLWWVEGDKFCLRFSIRCAFCPCGLPLFQRRDRFSPGTLPRIEVFHLLVQLGNGLAKFRRLFLSTNWAQRAKE